MMPSSTELGSSSPDYPKAVRNRSNSDGIELKPPQKGMLKLTQSADQSERGLSASMHNIPTFRRSNQRGNVKPIPLPLTPEANSPRVKFDCLVIYIAPEWRKKAKPLMDQAKRQLDILNQAQLVLDQAKDLFSKTDPQSRQKEETALNEAKIALKEANSAWSEANELWKKEEKGWKRELSIKRESYFDQLLKDVPPYSVDMVKKVGQSPIITIYNNYGVTPDPGTPILKTSEKITFTLKNKPIVITSPPAFTDDKQIFAFQQPSIFADSISFLQNTKGFQAFSLADGCNWGLRAQVAAQTATEAALEFFAQATHGQNKATTREIAAIHLKAFVVAHQKLIGMEEKKVAETTMMMGTVAGSYGIFTSLGDCQAYIIRQTEKVRKCFTIFQENRSCSFDAKDPGGRIGPYQDADWRNLAVAVIKLEPKDVIILSSDGMGDNLEAHLHNPKLDEKTRLKLINRKVAEIAGDNPATMGQQIVQYISDITEGKKLLMLQGEKEIDDGTKLDHVSVLVSEYSPSAGGDSPPPEKKSFLASFFNK